MTIQLFTLKELINLIYILNTKMEENNIDKEELYAFGSFACLSYNYKEKDEDIDVYTKNDIYEIRRLAYDIGLQYNSLGWFSNLNSLADRGLSPKLEEYLNINGAFIKYLSLSKLDIYIQSPNCLLYTKLCAFRNKDLEDIISILKSNNLYIKEDILNFINDYLSINFKPKEEIIKNIEGILKKL